MTFVFQRVHSVSVSVETGEESQGRILHIIIGPLVLMSLNYFQIHKDAFPEELLSCEKEMRNPHPFELLVSEYFNHSIMDSKSSL